MLKLTNLSMVFNPGSINEVRALTDVSLHLPPGEFVSVIGSNGAGKSTLLNTIAGVFPVTQGRITIDGQDVTAWPEHRRAALVGRVFQDPLLGTAASMTIEQNLTLAIKRGLRRGLRRGVTPHLRARFREALAQFGLGLEDRLDARVRLLSGGQRQTLTLLMATLAQPKVLLLDEHTAALDPATAHRIVTLTNDIVGQTHLTTLMVTHNMKQALEMGARTLMMHNGEILFDFAGQERANLTVAGLLEMFAQVRQQELADDRLLLADR
ncbi:MAG: ATP-binding cassette domain-containing protein [Anaerolineaceae bacterium]|nr:ATP-binding cassette domain-containing protein [Anaerolineaceae bacterium]